MQTFKHLLNTWLLAYLAFPIFYTGYFLLLYNDADFRLLPLLFIFGFIFSLPAGIICLFLLRVLVTIDLGYELRFLYWLLIVAGSIVTTAAAICLLLFDLQAFSELLPFIVAAVVSAIASVLIRFNQFIYLMHLKSTEHENNMV